MDTKYHIKLVENPSTNYKRTKQDTVLVATATQLYPAVEQAMTDLLADGDYQKYISAIEPYDRFVWEASHQGDKSNIFAYKKIKVSPTWTEQIWAPVFERVRRAMETHWKADLVLIQNLEVVESLGANGPSAFKDVDGGLGVVKSFPGFKKQVVMPIVVAEDKTGHFCKTACTGVDAIIRRVRGMNPNVLAFGVTDNNISVGKDAEVDNVYGAGGLLIQQRGRGFNQKKVAYPTLNYEEFALVERLCINYLRTKKLSDFTDVTPGTTSGTFLRKELDEKGHYIPPELEQFA